MELLPNMTTWTKSSFYNRLWSVMKQRVINLIVGQVFIFFITDTFCPLLEHWGYKTQVHVQRGRKSLAVTQSALLDATKEPPQLQSVFTFHCFPPRTDIKRYVRIMLNIVSKSCWTNVFFYFILLVFLDNFSTMAKHKISLVIAIVLALLFFIVTIVFNALSAGICKF